MRLFVAFLLVAFLLLPVALAVSESPLTNPQFTWDLGFNETTLGLPWYSVSQWEVEVCTRGLTSTVGTIPGTNDITDYSLSTPIYMDTVTLLAKKTEYADGAYYEIGWYVQPFAGQMGARVLAIDAFGRNTKLAQGDPSAGAAFDGYLAFPVPCDASVYGSRCLLDTAPNRVRLEWWATNGTNNGPVQHLTSGFVNSTGGS